MNTEQVNEIKVIAEALIKASEKDTRFDVYLTGNEEHPFGFSLVGILNGELCESSTCIREEDILSDWPGVKTVLRSWLKSGLQNWQ